MQKGSSAAYSVREKIKKLRMARGLKQSDIDANAGLPTNSISKIERGIRSATAEELIRIAKTLGVPLDAFSDESTAYVAREEVKIVEALRELSFEEYRDFLRKVEARIYFKAKDAHGKEKIGLGALVSSLRKMCDCDLRPRTNIAANIRESRKG